MAGQSPYWQREFIETLELAEARGGYRALKFFLEHGEKALVEDGQPKYVERLRAIKARTAAAFAHEESHGEGSLLKLDHPANKMFMKMGFMRVPNANPFL